MEAEQGKSLHYFRKNHLQKAWKIAGESGGQEERNEGKGQKKPTGGKSFGPHIQFTRMHDKLKRRVTLSECVDKMVPPDHL
jgi:hypothetical protein